MQTNHFNWDNLMKDRDVEDFLQSDDLWGAHQDEQNQGRKLWRAYLARKLEDGIPLRVLEVGFGSGIDYRGLEHAGLFENPNLEYNGVDVTQKFVEYAQTHYPHMNAQRIDGYHLPFPDQHFDVVYLRHIFEHQTHYTSLLAEVLRVCKDEVFVIFFIPLAELGQDQISFDGTWHNNRYSRSGLLEFLKKHNFDAKELASFHYETGYSDDQIFLYKRQTIDTQIAPSTNIKQKLSIAFATHQYPTLGQPTEGIASYIITIARELVAEGHEVHIVTSAHPDQLSDWVDAGVNIHQVDLSGPNAKDPAQVKAYSRAVAERLSTLDALYHFNVVEFQEWAAEGWAFQPRHDQLLVVRTQTPSWVIREFEYAQDTVQERQEDELERWPLERADMITTPSRLAARRLSEHWLVDAESSILIPNAINNREFISSLSTTRPSLPTILCVNRYTPLKGVEIFVRAAAIIHRRFPEIRFRMIGRNCDWNGQPADQYLRNLAYSLGLSNDVLDIPGPLLRHDLPAEYAAATICVNPSLYENVSHVTLEALSCGRPTIFTSGQGNAEYMSAGEDCLIVPPNDVDALASAMIELLDDTERCERMGAAARRTIDEKFSATVVAKQLEDAYRQGLYRIATRPLVKSARINIALLTHNALEYTQKCLVALANHTLVPHNIFIVDNASTDGTQKWLSTQSNPNLHITFSTENLGVPGGRNRLLREILPHLSDDGLIVFLDNDVEVGADWYTPFFELFADHPEVGVAGKTGCSFIVHAESRELLPSATTTPTLVDVVSGFCLIVRAETARIVGFFDEKLNPFWHEDDDYCVRAIALGYEVYAVPDVALLHHEHKSGFAQPDIVQGGSLKNQLYLVNKWRQLGYVDMYGLIVHHHTSEDLKIRQLIGKRLGRSNVIAPNELQRAVQDLTALLSSSDIAGYIFNHRYELTPTLSALLQINIEQAWQDGARSLAELLEQVAQIVQQSNHSAELRPSLKLPVKKPGPTRTNDRLCKVADIDDWNKPEWLAIVNNNLRQSWSWDYYLRPRKIWEWAQILYGLRKLGRLHSESIALDVGSGHDRLLWTLANELRLVIATDIYGDKLASDFGVSQQMLTQPERLAPFPYRRNNLLAIRMDGRELQFPDNYFDFAVSVSSIEHFGGHVGAAQSLREQARVIKPGGIVAFATEVILNGVYDNDFFLPEELLSDLVIPSGLHLIEDIDFTLNNATLDRFADFAVDINRPHFVLRNGKSLFTSVVLFLEKPDPNSVNSRDTISSLSDLAGTTLSKSNESINLISHPCRAEEFDEIWFDRYCQELKENKHYHRKLWEFCSICNILDKFGTLVPGSSGLGFGVGKEPLGAYFAKRGCNVLATDLDPDQAKMAGWIQSNQHSSNLLDLNERKICDDAEFSKLVRFMPVDMNDIPSSLHGKFDFTWSSCSLEHCGSISLGSSFIINQLKCLKPGGIAVHTTEYNVSSDTSTVEEGGTVIFRKQDIERIKQLVTSQGYEMTVDYSVGNTEIDNYIDLPPYKSDPHLKLRLMDYTSTSIVLIIKKPNDEQSIADHTPAKNRYTSTAALAAQPMQSSHPFTIGVDIRTLCYPSSVTRGIGHYTLNHLSALIKQTPNWQYHLLFEELPQNDSLAQLSHFPNVQVLEYSKSDANCIDLFHIPDPMGIYENFDSPFRVMNGVPVSMVFYDLIPLIIKDEYLDTWNQGEQAAYRARLKQVQQSHGLIFSISANTQNDLHKHLAIPTDQVKVIMAGLNKSRGTGHRSPAEVESTLMKYGIKKPFFLNVGSLDPHKSFSTSIGALLLTQSNIEVQLVVAGSLDTLKQSYKEELERRKISNVIFTGFISRVELEDLYSAATALVFPSKYEGFGFPVIEAMARGCPVITCDVASLPEVAGDAAILVRPNSPRDVANAMIDLIQKPKMREEIIRKGIVQAAKFTWEECALKTIEAIQSKFPNSRDLSFHSRKPPSTEKPLERSRQPIVWNAPIYDPSGYADEARHFLAQLSTQGIKIAARPIGRHSVAFRNQVAGDLRQQLDDLLEKDISENPINIIHFPAYVFERVPQAAYNIGRVMFETDSLPTSWVAKCNLMDELWVPTEFNIETFRRAGVTTRITKIHGGIDTQRFHPQHKPLKIPDLRGTVFLSIFEWSYRKGWDVLLQAWANAFTAKDDVCLVLRAYPLNNIDVLGNKIIIERYINAVIEEGLNLKRADLAPIIVLGDQIGEDDFPRLFTAAHCYVAPSRGEGWGRPHMQAMASALPVIATRWSGNLEFMNDDNSLLLQADAPVEIDQREELNFYWGQRWAEPSVAHLIELMQWVHTHRDEAKQIGERARHDMVLNWQWSHVANQAAHRLQEIQKELNERHTQRHFNIRWEGDQLRHSSLSLINREVGARLLQRGHEIVLKRNQPDQFTAARFEILKQGDAANLTHPIEVNIAHQYPPVFDPPSAGHWVMIQPWEFGSLPKEWIEKMNASVDEVWAYTHFVRDCYIQSGLDPERVFVIPCGVNTDLFNPYIEPLNLPTHKKFKFLFVGGTIWRKGIDLLLEAYLQTFTRTDEVCLVIKDVGGGSFYQDQNFSQLIQQAQQDPNAPEIVYLDVNLSPDDLPRLYTACDCLVHPYRGEGFGLPIAEAMACALPVIVTGAGSSQDFCNAENAYLLSAEKRLLDHTHATQRETVSTPFVYEPSVNDLVSLMRHVVNNPDEAKARGARARDEIRAHFTWDHVVKQIEERLSDVVQKPIRRGQEAVTATAPIDPQLIAAFAQGEAAIQEGDLQRAATIFKKIANDHPQLAEAHHALGTVYLAQNDHSRAIKALRRALRCAPKDVNLKNQLGVAYFKNNEFNQAAEIFKEALQTTPNNMVTLLNLVALYQTQKQFAPAAAFIKQALAAEPNNTDVLITFANLSLEIGNYEAAQIAIEKVKRIAPEHPALSQFTEALAA